MAFPVSPANGQTATVNGITYVYSSTYGSWTRTSSSLSSLPSLYIVGNVNAGNVTANSGTASTSTTTGALVVTGGVGVSGALYVANTGDVSANIGTIRTNLNTLDANVGAYETWANTSIVSLYTNANANTAAYLTTYTGNIQAGNISVTGNVNVTSNVFANKLYTTNGLYWAGNGNVISTGGGSLTSGNTAPASPNVGDFWYKISVDTLYQYINDGTTSYWVDIQTSVIAANAGTAITDSINANIGAFYTYANTKIGTNANNNIIASNIISSGSGVFQGPYNEASTLSGVFVGNTGTAPGITPRVGFFNGNVSQNWQIDNNSGEFRWFVPGSTKMSLYSTGNLNVAGGYTVGGKKAVNGPAFRAFVAVGQTIVGNGTQQRVTFGSETFDTDNNFTSSRFTPTVEGYYQLNATIRISGTAGTGENMLVLYKNGGEYARGTNGSGTEIGASFYSMQASDIAYANGTTDFFEVYIQQGSGGNRDTTAGTNISYFSGCMIRGA